MSHEKRSHHWTFFLSGSNHNKPFIPEHVRTVHSAAILVIHGSSRMNSPTFWKRFPSVFKWTFSDQVDWKRRFSGTVPRSMHLTLLDPFLYCLLGENCTSLMSVTSHNRHLQQWLNMSQDWYNFDRCPAAYGAHIEISRWQKRLWVLHYRIVRSLLYNKYFFIYKFAFFPLTPFCKTHCMCVYIERGWNGMLLHF